MKIITDKEKDELLIILKSRFEKNMSRHPNITWQQILEKISNNTNILWSLSEMEKTGGEPDVVVFDQNNNEYTYFDCSKESPSGRRNLCYDREALDTRKKFKPANNAIDMATEMNIKIVNEEEYRLLQQLESFDLKTSSWLETPIKIRKLGGAIFGDKRYDNIFIYHNGAESYYSNRGFRGSLRI